MMSSSSFSFAILLFTMLLLDCDGLVEDEENYHIFNIHSLLPATVCSPYNGSQPASPSSLNITHTNGPCSPLGWNGHWPTFDEILQQDLPRVDYLYQQSSSNNSFNGVILPVRVDGNYLVSVGFGTPRVDRHVLFDTGSSLTWTSCHGYHSHSYSRIPLDSRECNRLPFKTSAYQPACGYDARYSDGARIKGVFGHDALALGQSEAAREFIFGCSYEHPDRDQGLLGLGRSWISLFEQARERFEGQFSYCLPTPSSVGHLTLGRSQYAHSLSFTPLLDYRDKEHYYVELRSIVIGRHTINIGRGTPAMVDSGATLTYLPPAAYAELRQWFMEGMSMYPRAPSARGLDTCYDLSGHGERASIPRVTLQFAGGVEVVVEKEGTVHAADVSSVCLAFVPRRRQGEEIVLLGSLVQIRKEVSYRPNADRVGFGPGDC